MILNDNQINILDHYRRQKSLLADLYRLFAERLPADRAFWDRLVQAKQMHAQIIEKLRDATQKGALTFEEVKSKTDALDLTTERIQDLLKKAQQGDIDRTEALTQALKIESSLIGQGAFSQFKPLTEKAGSVLRKLSAENLNHVVRIREMLGPHQKVASNSTESQTCDPESKAPGKRLVWTTEMSVDIPNIDAQHRFLFGQINELVDLRERGGSRERLLRVLKALMHFSDAHFDSEDEVMIDSDFPLFINHRAEHQKYITHLAGFVDQYVKEERNLPDKMLEFLVAWWFQHTCQSDQKYARWIHSQGAKQRSKDPEELYPGPFYPEDP